MTNPLKPIPEEDREVTKSASEGDGGSCCSSSCCGTAKADAPAAPSEL